jgi:hypothetical protein
MFYFMKNYILEFAILENTLDIAFSVLFDLNKPSSGLASAAGAPVNFF